MQKSLARHNAAMDAYYSDQFVLPLPEGHRFPMAKYAMLREAISTNLPAVSLREAPAASDLELAMVPTFLPCATAPLKRLRCERSVSHGAR